MVLCAVGSLRLPRVLSVLIQRAASLSNREHMGSVAVDSAQGILLAADSVVEMRLHGLRPFIMVPLFSVSMLLAMSLTSLFLLRALL